MSEQHYEIGQVKIFGTVTEDESGKSVQYTATALGVEQKGSSVSECLISMAEKIASSQNNDPLETLPVPEQPPAPALPNNSEAGSKTELLSIDELVGDLDRSSKASFVGVIGDCVPANRAAEAIPLLIGWVAGVCRRVGNEENPSNQGPIESNRPMSPWYPVGIQILLDLGMNDHQIAAFGESKLDDIESMCVLSNMSGGGVC